MTHSPAISPASRVGDVHDDSADFSSQSEDSVQRQIQSPESAFDVLLHAQPATKATEVNPKLSYPVVIPQRRPGNKERGFMYAYTPDLEKFGISQDTFVEFIHATNKASQASKGLVAIQVAAAGASFVPNHIALGVSAAVQIIAGVVARAEIKWKTNSFMDRVNNEFFRPRGLYCLLMAYNPTPTDQKTSVTTAEAVSKREPASDDPALGAKVKRNFRNPIAGTSQGQENLPDSVAPLTYLESGLSAPKGNGSKVFSRLNDYFDRRAQARYAAESKGDVLSAAPSKPFSNRYLDPNHPASNGGLIGLLSGGKLVPDPDKQKDLYRSVITAQEQSIRDQHVANMDNVEIQLQGLGLSPEQERDYRQQYEDVYQLQTQQTRLQMELLEQGHRRINRNILYLMIVNMPTEAEMAAACAESRDDGNGSNFIINNTKVD